MWTHLIKLCALLCFSEQKLPKYETGTFHRNFFGKRNFRVVQVAYCFFQFLFHSILVDSHLRTRRTANKFFSFSFTICG